MIVIKRELFLIALKRIAEPASDFLIFEIYPSFICLWQIRHFGAGKRFNFL